MNRSMLMTDVTTRIKQRDTRLHEHETRGAARPLCRPPESFGPLPPDAVQALRPANCAALRGSQSGYVAAALIGWIGIQGN